MNLRKLAHGASGRLPQMDEGYKALEAADDWVRQFALGAMLPVSHWTVSRLDVAADLVTGDIASLLADLRRTTVLRGAQELVPYEHGSFAVRSRRVYLRAYIRPGANVVRVERQLTRAQIKSKFGQRDARSVWTQPGSQETMERVAKESLQFCRQFDPGRALNAGVNFADLDLLDRLCLSTGPQRTKDVPSRLRSELLLHGLGWAKCEHEAVERLFDAKACGGSW